MLALVQFGMAPKHLGRHRPVYNRMACAVADEAGNNLVEFAIVATLFFTVIFAIMSSALAVYSYFYLSDAARQGTRYAMVRGSTWTTDCSSPGPANCIAQNADIQTYIRNFAFPGINSSNVNASATWLTGSGGSCGTADSCKSPGNRVQVKVTYSYSVSLPLVPQQTINMSSTSQMVISQ